MGNNELERKELREAIAAGERALSTLYLAEKKLDQARNWGIFDMLGGGSITGLIKHSAVSSASSLAEQARQDLETFRRELRDVHIPDMRIEIDGFLTFADFFFDGFIADFLVQRKISDARGKVEDAIRQVENILGSLRGYL